MRATRVRLRAEVASFRHPFFVTGQQPSATFPPPSTIHGLCAAALGVWPDPEQFSFGLRFVWRARARDLEHQHLAQRAASGTKLVLPSAEGPRKATTEIGVQPVVREFLFGCELTLYLAHIETRTTWSEAFRRPVWPLTLGRSQDLAEVVEVTELELVATSRARLEHTLLPRALRPAVRHGQTVLLSRYVGPAPERPVVFEQYIALHEPVFLGTGADEARAVLDVPGLDWSALHAPSDGRDDEGWPCGVYLLRLTG
jgi:CRISPR-associated protein Cas5t